VLVVELHPEKLPSGAITVKSSLNTWCHPGRSPAGIGCPDGELSGVAVEVGVLLTVGLGVAVAVSMAVAVAVGVLVAVPVVVGVRVTVAVGGAGAVVGVLVAVAVGVRRLLALLCTCEAAEKVPLPNPSVELVVGVLVAAVVARVAVLGATTSSIRTRLTSTTMRGQ
jgi:hypothetical protein